MTQYIASIRLTKLLNLFYSYPDFYDPRSVTLTDQNLLVPGSLVLPTQKIHNQNRNDNQNYLPHNYNEHQSGVLNIQCHREREENKKKNNNSSFFNAISHRNMCGQPSSSFSSSSSAAITGHTERSILTYVLMIAMIYSVIDYLDYLRF